ncbi:hypothetical protein VTG60DRAFT_6793 [Thermothelomyces hinnuleus]
MDRGVYCVDIHGLATADGQRPIFGRGHEPRCPCRRWASAGGFSHPVLPGARPLVCPAHRSQRSSSAVCPLGYPCVTLFRFRLPRPKKLQPKQMVAVKLGMVRSAHSLRRSPAGTCAREHAESPLLLLYAVSTTPAPPPSYQGRTTTHPSLPPPRFPGVPSHAQCMHAPHFFFGSSSICAAPGTGCISLSLSCMAYRNSLHERQTRWAEMGISKGEFSYGSWRSPVNTHRHLGPVWRNPDACASCRH